MQPRENRLPWTDHHMIMALVASMRSPDPNTRVGAVIVSNNNRILATGYNSFPSGICSTAFSWDRSDSDPLKTKYPYVVHAEDNAIHNRTKDLEGSTLYVTMFPCNECAKAVIQEGITRVIYLHNPYADLWQTKAAASMFGLLDIEVRQHQWSSQILNHLQDLVILISQPPSSSSKESSTQPSSQ